MALDEFYSFDVFTIAHIGDDSFFDRINETNINTPNQEGWTLLMYACNSGNFEFVDFLLKKGALTTCRSPDNRSPLILAIGSGNLRLVKAVFSSAALEDPDTKGWTPLFHAVYYGRETCAEFLLEQGANAYTLDKTNRTPISLATHFGMDSMVAVLLRNRQTSTPQKINVLNHPYSNRSKSTPRRSLNFFKPLRTFSPNVNLLKNELKENLTPIQVKPKIITCVTPQRRGMTPPIISVTTPNSTPLKEKFTSDPSYVLTFLTDIGMARYWPIFQREEVDFDTFITFNEDNLNDIGINLYGPRRKISMAIQEFRAMHGSGSRFLKNSRWMK